MYFVFSYFLTAAKEEYKTKKSKNGENTLISSRESQVKDDCDLRCARARCEKNCTKNKMHLYFLEGKKEMCIKKEKKKSKTKER